MKLFKSKQTKEDFLLKVKTYTGQRYMTIFYRRPWHSDKIYPELFYFNTKDEFNLLCKYLLDSSLYSYSTMTISEPKHVYEINAIYDVKKKFDTEMVEQKIFKGFDFKCK